MHPIDATHAAELNSWVESANQPDTDFPIQNLPYCVFTNGNGPRTIGVGIGDQVLDLRVCASKGLLNDALVDAVSDETLAGVMGLPAGTRRALRHHISGMLAAETKADRAAMESALLFQSDVQFSLPCRIRDYTDFYASVFHATNVGSMFRPTNPLLPNYKHIPIGYHGRASSIVVSGTEFKRPIGQKAPSEEGGMPTRGPAALLDYEMEAGFFVAQGNELGTPISIGDAEDYIFGMCLLNDWSARDLQKWEYQPLGPFLAKSFASSISPWVVTMEALAPFRCSALKRPEGDPKPLDYLSSAENEAQGGVDIQLEVYLSSEKMREEKIAPHKLSQTSFTNMYWTMAQMLTHHSSNGCNMQPGDMLGSGTISGPERGERGSMLELTWDGDADNPVPGSQRTPLKLPTGEERKFIADGDEVIMAGFCEKEGFRRIGFGTCRGTILPAG